MSQNNKKIVDVDLSLKETVQKMAIMSEKLNNQNSSSIISKRIEEYQKDQKAHEENSNVQNR